MVSTKASISKAKQLAKKKKSPAKPQKIASRTRQSMKAVVYRWHNQELNIIADAWNPISTAHNVMKTPLEYFQLFIDEEVMKTLVVYTNQYAAKKNKLGNVTEDEIWSFVAILLPRRCSPESHVLAS
ncbi:piggyBac transposable element derived [Nesidiocoris tenuis]|uniref:PiggyBac transposable element derived n=1 Tax=Nesidiocoris tenuis TaxID=355587 RepID=A0ABN7A8N9_9HEMI|nr:piggyBac transposable element derived [Nesidiocoris tenuis]